MSERAPSRGVSEKMSMLAAIGFATDFSEMDDGDVTLLSGEPNLYGVYESSKVDVFDSDETFQQAATPVVNADIAINNAEKFLRLVVGDRKILLESEVDVMPASFRVDLSAGDQYMTNTQQTRDLVDRIISGASMQTTREAEADHENFLSGIYVDNFLQISRDVCRISENLLDVFQEKHSHLPISVKTDNEGV